MTTVLVVEDEKPLREFISRNLTARGFQVLSAANGLEALALFHTANPDLVIMDIMMPHMDGLETCRRMRQNSTVPIIMLTALGEETDKVLALDQGADDYLTKPFGVEELLARVRAMTRRISWEATAHQRHVVRHGELELDIQRHELTVRGLPVRLTRTEFRLLRYLMENAGKALPHRHILQQVWGDAYGDEAEYLRVYVGRLRQKIEPDPAEPVHLVTVYGVGYRFEA